MLEVASPAYVPTRLAKSIQMRVNAVDYHVREWGDPLGRPLVFLHGARDSSASFQVVADMMPDGFRMLAPDWRGHGRSGHTPLNYWQADFLVDLEAVLSALVPDTKVPLVAHSMGGKIASIYAGLRPDRVASLTLLDVLGFADVTRGEMAQGLSELLGQVRDPVQHREYPSIQAMAQKMMMADPRLDPSIATFLAQANVRPVAAGSVMWPHDPGFRKSRPTLQDQEQWAEIWSRIEAPVLALQSSDPRTSDGQNPALRLASMAAHFANIKILTIPDTGHNLHLHAPSRVTEELLAFI